MTTPTALDGPTGTRDGEPPPMDRRRFVGTALGTGFAAAVLPVAAQTTIRTDTAGLTAGEVEVPVGDFRLPAYRAQPAGGRNLPVVLVVSEIFGVHEHIADVCRRFAKAGWLAIAPDLFVRQGDPRRYDDIPRLMTEVIAKTPDAQVMADLDACTAWARSNGGDGQRLGITGFCWGGRITWLYTAHNPAVKAGVAWYGRLVGPTNPLQPRHPVDVAAALHGPVLGLYGAEDTGIPLESVERMKTALAQGGDAAKRSSITVYPGAPHAFHADYRPSYRAEAAKDGWNRCVGWLRANGAG